MELLTKFERRLLQQNLNVHFSTSAFPLLYFQKTVITNLTGKKKPGRIKPWFSKLVKLTWKLSSTWKLLVGNSGRCSAKLISNPSLKKVIISCQNVLLPSNPHAESEHNPSYHSAHSSQSDALSPSLSESAFQSVGPSGYRGRTWLPDGSSQSEIESRSVNNIQETRILPCNVSSHSIPVSGGGLQQKPYILRMTQRAKLYAPFCYCCGR